MPKNQKMGEYTKEVSNFWDKYTKGAVPNKYMVMVPMIEKLKDYFGSLSGKTGIDYGCGVGDVTHELSLLGAKVIGIDISPDQLSKAKDKYGHLDFIDKIDSIEDEGVDFVYFKFSLCAMDDEAYEKVLKDVYKKLKKSGIIVIGDQNRDECVGKETFCEYYPLEESRENGHERKTILKIGGTKMSDGLKKGIDYQEVTDHFRSQEYTKLKLEKAGFIDVLFSFPKMPNNPNWEPMDELKTNIYKITTAIKG